MSISVLIGLATTYGVPMILKLLKGGKRGAIETVIKTIADKLGVSPSTEAIVDAEKADPKAFQNAVLLAEQSVGEMAKAAASATRSYHDTIEGDQKSESFMARTWRPFNGFMFAMECGGLTGGFIYLMLSGAVDTIAAASGSFGFLGTVLTAHAGVVGVYTWRRTTEKQNRSS